MAPKPASASSDKTASSTTRASRQPARAHTARRTGIPPADPHPDGPREPAIPVPASSAGASSAGASSAPGSRPPLAAIIKAQEKIFIDRQPESARLASLATGALAGGVVSNWQISRPQPVWLSHGLGSKLYDVDGNEYVDLHGGYGVSLAGHGHPAIVEAVQAQVLRGTHFAQPTKAALDCATDLTAVVSFNDLAAVRRTLEEHPGQVAGMILEPIMMSAGIIKPEPGYLAGLKELLHARGALLTFDEVKT